MFVRGDHIVCRTSSGAGSSGLNQNRVASRIQCDGGRNDHTVSVMSTADGRTDGRTDGLFVIASWLQFLSDQYESFRT